MKLISPLEVSPLLITTNNHRSKFGERVRQDTDLVSPLDQVFHLVYSLL